MSKVVERECVQCKATFPSNTYSPTSYAKYCSKECRKKSRQESGNSTATTYLEGYYKKTGQILGRGKVNFSPLAEKDYKVIILQGA